MFPPPSLKFRTSGFPQYGFKPDFGDNLHRPTRPAYMPPGVQDLCPYGPYGHVNGVAAWTLRSIPMYIGIGSPAGYVVPPGHRLLWPHPRLSASPVDLWINTTGLCIMPRPRASPIYSACPSLRATSRTPADRTAADGCYFAVRGSLRPICTGSASAGSRKSVRAWLRNEAAEFALCCGPESCWPFTDKDFYFRAFIP